MTGVACLRYREGSTFLPDPEHDSPVVFTGIGSPAADRELGQVHPLENVAIVVGADRVIGPEHDLRRLRAERKHIQHDHPAEAPLLGEGNAAVDRPIVLAFVRRAGVETAESY